MQTDANLMSNANDMEFGSNAINQNTYMGTMESVRIKNEEAAAQNEKSPNTYHRLNPSGQMIAPTSSSSSNKVAKNRMQKLRRGPIAVSHQVSKLAMVQENYDEAAINRTGERENEAHHLRLTHPHNTLS